MHGKSNYSAQKFQIRKCNQLGEETQIIQQEFVLIIGKLTKNYKRSILILLVEDQLGKFRNAHQNRYLAIRMTKNIIVGEYWFHKMTEKSKML